MKNLLPSAVERLFLILVIMCCGSALGEDLMVAGSDEHAWFIIASPETQSKGLLWSLSHSGTREKPTVHRSIRRFQEQPTSLAALGNSVWFTLPASEGRLDLIPVRVLQMEWNTGLERYLPTPRAGMTLLPSIQTDSEDPAVPVNMVATSAGPVILLVHQSGTRSIQALRRGQWQDIELPQDVPKDQIQLGSRDDQIVLFWKGEGGTWLQARSDEEWLEARLQTGLSSLIDVFPIDARLLTVSEISTGMIELKFIQPDGLAMLAQLPVPKSNWSLLGRGGQIMLVRSGDEIEISHIDPLDGSRSDWEVLPEGAVLGISTWSLMISLLLSGLVLVILLRGVTSTEASWPTGAIPMTPFGRLIALAVDAIPGLIVTIGWLDAKPRIILDAFSLSLRPEEWLTYGLLVLTTCLWCLFWELAIRTSPGKLLMGGYLANLDGSRPSAARVLLRSAFKCLMLLFPILMVTALRPPSLQSLGDQFSRILVLERLKRQPDHDDQT